MALPDSLTIMRDVSAALTHAHLHGVLHGGLSPESIVISGGSALVSDLGIQEIFAGLRQQGARSATLAPGASEPLRYSAPEQASGKPVERMQNHAMDTRRALRRMGIDPDA